jgi:uncharacterized membrane protein YgcG
MKSAIKRVLAVLVLVGITGLLSGCYIAPGYSYVQSNGYVGDAYYGTAPAVAYGYPYYYGYPYGYYGYYGCCYGPGVVVGGYWYGGRYYRGRGGWSGGRGGWSGGHAASHGSSGGGGHSSH